MELGCTTGAAFGLHKGPVLVPENPTKNQPKLTHSHASAVYSPVFYVPPHV